MLKLNLLNHPICLETPSRLTPASAWHEHIPFAMFLVDVSRPKIIVELGTQSGDSYCAFCQAVKELYLDTLCYAIDTWQGDPHAGLYGPEVLADLRSHHDPLYGGFSCLIQSTFDEALAHFADETVDLLHIDGYHTYESVKHDFESWIPKISPSGLVLLHDTNVREHDFGIRKFWDEIKSKYPHFEFLHGHGLGILAIGQIRSPELKQLFQLSEENSNTVREFFFHLGQRLTTKVRTEVRDAELNNILHAKDAQITELKETRDESILALQNTVKARDESILALHSEWLDSSNRSESLQNDLQLASNQIIELNNLVDTQNRAIQQIMNGLVMHLMTKIKMGMDKIMPAGTRRNYYYNLLLRALQILAIEGWSSLWQKIKSRYFNAKRSGGSLNIPLEYQRWINQNEPGKKDLAKQRKGSRKLTFRPRIGFVAAIQPSQLLSFIKEVNQQTYDNWDLYLIVENKDEEKIHRSVIKTLSRQLIKKINFIHSESKNRDSATGALAGCATEYLCLLTGDIRLAPFALYHIVEYINEHPGCDFIYTDHDEMSIVGNRRYCPIFKPDWSPDMLRSFNYIGRFFIARKNLIEKLEPPMIPAIHDECDVYDLALRLTEKSELIGHIPAILFHQTDVPTRVLGNVEDDSANTYRQALLAPWAYANSKEQEVKYKFSLIILNRDKPQYIIPLIDSSQKGAINKEYEVIIGDTGTTDREVLKYYDSVKEQVKIVSGLKYHFSGNYNKLICEECSGETVGIMNNDIVLGDLTFLNDVENVIIENTGMIGVVGVKLLYPDGRLQHGGIFFMENAGDNTGFPYHRYHGGDPKRLPSVMIQDVPAVTGAFMFFNRRLFMDLHGFDEKYQKEAQDVDFCLKCLRNGKKNVFINSGSIVHIENGTRPKGDENPSDRQYFLWKWRAFLEAVVINKGINIL